MSHCQNAYALNINYFDALSSPNSSEPLACQVRRFLAALKLLPEEYGGAWENLLTGGRVGLPGNVSLDGYQTAWFVGVEKKKER